MVNNDDEVAVIYESREGSSQMSRDKSDETQRTG